ncbi:MAG: hypothetical protein WD424_09165 [Paenibacillaceae bacterium]
MIGSTRESVTVFLNGLVKDGVIMTGRKSIMVHVEKARECLKRGRNLRS